MKKINLILQGKGGVGKSLIASLLTQHYRARDIAPLCIDTDPVNATFSSYRAFEVQRLEILKDNNIDQRVFDELVETIIGAKDDCVAIIDNGAATFVPLCSYLVENDVLGFFNEQGLAITIHTVMTGGQALEDTTLGLANLFDAFPEIPICIWFNEFWGKPQKEGTPFETTRLYKDNAHQISALVCIPQVRKETFGRDLDQMLKEKLTFEEVQSNPDFTIMAKQRIRMMWNDLSEQMTQANL